MYFLLLETTKVYIWYKHGFGFFFSLEFIKIIWKKHIHVIKLLLLLHLSFSLPLYRKGLEYSPPVHANLHCSSPDHSMKGAFPHDEGRREFFFFLVLLALAVYRIYVVLVTCWTFYPKKLCIVNWTTQSDVGPETLSTWIPSIISIKKFCKNDQNTYYVPKYMEEKTHHKNLKLICEIVSIILIWILFGPTEVEFFSWNGSCGDSRTRQDCQLGTGGGGEYKFP